MKAQSAINRILLALAGLVLLGGGLLVLAGGLDIYRRWHLAPPAGWPLATGNAVLLSRADRTRFDTGQNWWWWPAVIAALALVALAALWWLLAQLRQRRPGRLAVGSAPPQEGVELRDDALSKVIAAEAGRLPGIRHAQARFVGRSARPQAHVRLTLTSDASPAAALHALCQGPLDRARRSAGWEHLPTEARLHVARHAPHRAE
jgi:hypothetical protein